MTDFSLFVSSTEDGRNAMQLQVDGMHCASCAWRIESALAELPDVDARVNFSTERLSVRWDGTRERANDLAAHVESLGFRVAPFDSASKHEQETQEETFLLRCLAVSGFASGNLMIFSLALWFSGGDAMGTATRDLMHWIMAAISLPTIVYAGRPFFYSAWEALRNRHTNMDVPISLAVTLAAIMSLHETIRHGPYVYFDASVMLLFFLIIGRYLDKKARGRAREAAQGLLAMLEGSATILENGATKNIVIRDIRQGMRLLVAAGEKIAADGVVAKGASEIDSSFVTGETLPRTIASGDKVYAGMINLAAPVEIDVSAASDKSLLADIVNLLEKAEQGQATYVRLADRVAGFYTPAVHALAALTFLGWWMLAGSPWQVALLHATAVLIITCPCALGLAVPVVQVLASSRLFKKGLLLKSGNALEKLADIDTVIFDKTGTLTLGSPVLIEDPNITNSDLQLAASMAAHSKHPLAKALTGSWDGRLLDLAVREVTACGLETEYKGRMVRLGKRSWCGDAAGAADEMMELWLNDGTGKSVRFTFSDRLRQDAEHVVRRLKSKGLRVVLLSGDRKAVAAHIAEQAGISEFHGDTTPVDKTRMIEDEVKNGHRVLMVGDGLNDAPALAAATVSMSPASAADITQNAADMVFRGTLLEPVITALQTSVRANRLVKENFALSLGYNVIAVPLAVLGLVTPLIAAIAMSSSSLLVIANSFRLNREN